MIRRVVKGLRWVFHDISMVIKAPKVSIISKAKLLVLYVIYHVLKIDFSKFRIFVSIDGVKYRFISYDELSILVYLELLRLIQQV